MVIIEKSRHQTHLAMKTPWVHQILLGGLEASKGPCFTLFTSNRVHVSRRTLGPQSDGLLG